jgi:hypothetical protein
MRLRHIQVACPKCGSSNVAYSCEPECCFNHVCGDCLSSFQLETLDLGGRASDLEPVGDIRDTCLPTAACARCDSINVWMTDGTNSLSDPHRAICADCGANLELVLK